jgi:hypothetical protein
MGNKSLRIALKNDRVERVEELSLKIGKAVNDNILRLGRDITSAKESLELIYEELMARTLGGRWKRFKKWIGGKK